MKRKLMLLCSTLLLSLGAMAQHRDIPATNEFSVKGAVKNELTLTIKDLAQFPQESLANVQMKNKQGESKGEMRGLKGIPLKAILDSAHVTAAKHKEYSELVVVLIASDDYRNVYSWNEIFNTPVGDKVYIITEMDGKKMDQVESRIVVMSLADENPGRRHLKGLARIEVKKVP